MRLFPEVEPEEDGRWLGEVLELPSVLAHGGTRAEAVAHVQVLALRVMADRIEHGEPLPQMSDVLPQATLCEWIGSMTEVWAHRKDRPNV